MRSPTVTSSSTSTLEQEKSLPLVGEDQGGEKGTGVIILGAVLDNYYFWNSLFYQDFNGKVMQTDKPPPKVFSATMAPWCNCTALSDIASPSPVPPV